MPATMEEVARRAAVSTATVSRVLNHPHLVNPETRQLVLSAIDDLGYRVNSSARSLRTSQTYIVAAVVDQLTDTITNSFLEAFEAHLVNSGYSLQICLVRHQQERVLHYLHELTQHGQVDGILWMTAYTDPRIMDKLTLANGHNVLLVDTRLAQSLAAEYQVLLCDYERAFYQATVYLIKNGFRQIGLLNLNETVSATAHLREQGYSRALQEHQIPLTKGLISISEAATMEAWQIAAEKLMAHLEYPSAIVAFDDSAAAQIYRIAASQGLRIPQDISVIGCGDFKIANYLTPPLTTFSLPLDTLAQAAAHQLLSPSDEMPQNLFNLEMVLRASVKTV